MQIVLTGAGGCLGHALVSALDSSGHVVFGAQRKLNQFPELTSLTHYREFPYDQKSPEADVFIHTAAVTPMTGKAFDENVHLTQKALKMAIESKANHFIHISTCNIDESDPYSNSKILAERLVESFCEQNQLPYTIFRCGLIYGPYDRGVIFKFIRLLNYPVFLKVGSGLAKKHLIASSTFANLILNSLQNQKTYNQIFEVGDARPISFNELFAKILESKKNKPLILTVPTPLVSFCIAMLRFAEKFKVPLPIKAKSLEGFLTSNHWNTQPIQDTLGIKLPDPFETELKKELDWAKSQLLVSLN